MCDKAVDVLLPALKFVFDYFAANEMLRKLDSILFSKDDILFVDVDSDIVIFLRMMWTIIL